MMGISWGGINALQVAARRPPALKAILTLCSTDDRYADDAHGMGTAC
jgi:predicted acyl esterase